MDDQNKNPDIQEHESSPANTQTPESQPTAQSQSQSNGLQPTQAFIEEMHSVTNNPPVVTNSQPEHNQPVPPSPNSIYPEATRGVGAHSDQTASTTNTIEHPSEKPKGNNSEQLIILAVIVLGILNALPALLRLIGSTKLISLGFVNGTSFVITLIDIIYLVIGVGLILRREIARAAYIFLAVILLILAIYGTFHTYSIEHNQSTQQGNLEVQLQYDVSYCLTRPASQQRNEIVQQLEKDINNNQQPKQTCLSTLGITNNQYVALIPSYLFAVIPLVFLTRPRVKEVFS